MVCQSVVMSVSNALNRRAEIIWQAIYVQRTCAILEYADIDFFVVLVNIFDIAISFFAISLIFL